MAGLEDYRVFSFYSPNPDSAYALEWDDLAHEEKLYGLNKGTLELLKTFNDVDPRYGLNDVEISKGGLLIRRKNKIKVYAWSDLKEIKFKKL